MDSAPTTWPRLGAFPSDVDPDDPGRLLEGFARCGLTTMQLGEAYLERAFADPAAIPAIRAELEAHGIAINGIAGYRNLVAPDPARRRAGLDFLKRCLETAPRFGVSVVATETGTRHPTSSWGASPENASEEARVLLDEALTELLAVAEAHGSVLALEGYVSHVLATPDQLAGILERFPTPHLQVVLDPFNYLSKELLPDRERVVAAFLDRFADRFVVAHLKDVSPEGAEVDTPEFGHGIFPQALYLDFLRTRRPDLPIMLEHLPFAHIPAAIRRIHAIAGTDGSLGPTLS